MVVIVVIGILVAMLVPAVSYVRTTARNAATQAVLTSISTGLETLKTDQKFGGRYPPSRSDWGQGVVSPYTGNTMQITGAGLLVWALSGADLLGSPGFKPFGNDQFWGQSTGSGQGDAYYILQSGIAAGKPQHTRAGLYVEPDKVRLSERGAGPGQYVIEAETKARRSQFTRPYPMYLDAFGYPILYWRADPAGRIMATERDIGLSPGNPRGIYHWWDNATLVSTDVPSLEAPQPLILNPSSARGNRPHKLEWDSYPDVAVPARDGLPELGTFQRFIINPDVQAKATPFNAKTYLLISPGADGIYGTADDKTNFEHGGQ
jgi:type II secretory pathway pseudopilin PulG